MIENFQIICEEYRYYLCTCVSFLRFIYFICIILATLGLHCCPRAFSSWGKWELLFVAVLRLLTVVASLVVEHRLQEHTLQELWCRGSIVVEPGLSCSVACWSSWTRDQTHVSCTGRRILYHWATREALAAGFLTTGPPGKSQVVCDGAVWEPKQD